MFVESKTNCSSHLVTQYLSPTLGYAVTTAQSANRVCNKQLLAPGSLGSRTGNASLSSWDRHFMHIFHMATQSTLAQITKDLQTEPRKGI